jgi:hypothetical protein
MKKTFCRAGMASAARPVDAGASRAADRDKPINLEGTA